MDKNIIQKQPRHQNKSGFAGTVSAIIFIFVLAAAVIFSLKSGTVKNRSALPGKSNADNVIAPKSSQILSDTEDEPEWNLILVNKDNPLPENYDIELSEVPGGEYVDERIYEPLIKMLEAAKESNSGQQPLVVSGYRTAEKQQQLYDEEIERYTAQGYSADDAKTLAEKWVARPGYSEHQLGFAVDINGINYDVYIWLQENSYKYGFIFRYPDNKTDITGIAEEIWHYRYVGTKAAGEIYEQGLCLEEYLENMR